MGRWTQYDEDDYRLGPGMKRTAYDADTQTYTFTDKSGFQYRSVPGSQFTLNGAVKAVDPARDRPQLFAGGSKPKDWASCVSRATTNTASHVGSKDSRKPPHIEETPSKFQDFLPADAITSPSSPPGSPETSASRWLDAARRTALPKLQGVVANLRRSSTSAGPRPVRRGSADDKKRGLLRNDSVASSTHSNWDDKKAEAGLGRSKTMKGPPRAFSLRNKDGIKADGDSKVSLRDQGSADKGMTERKIDDREPSHRRHHSEASRVRKDPKTELPSRTRSSRDKVEASSKQHLEASRVHKDSKTELPSRTRSSRDKVEDSSKQMDKLAGLPVPSTSPKPLPPRPKEHRSSHSSSASRHYHSPSEPSAHRHNTSSSHRDSHDRKPKDTSSSNADKSSESLSTSVRRDSQSSITHYKLVAI